MARSRVFSVATDKDKYDPGSTASVVLKSPFQKADALVIVETPEGHQVWEFEGERYTQVGMNAVAGRAAARAPVARCARRVHATARTARAPR